MNFKLRRLVRTETSEQYALDALVEGSEPASVGKLDLHYTDTLIMVTFLVWGPLFPKMDEPTLRSFVAGLVADFSAAVGMPEQYAIEYFVATKESYRYFSNVESESGD